MVININGIETNYVTEGAEGTPIVILPGWCATSAVYTLLVKQLSENHRVYAVDLPGFGITSEPPHAWSIDDYTDFVVSFVEKLQLDEIILIGHSYGGRIIINLCNREKNPFAVKEIVLIDSAGIKRPLSRAQQKRQNRFKRLKKIYSFNFVHALFPNALEKLQKKYGSSDYANASPIMKQTLVKSVTQDYTEMLPNVKQKALLIWGEQDQDTPLSDAYKMQQLIPNADLVTIKDAGHFPFLEQPFEFKKILNSHFSPSL